MSMIDEKNSDLSLNSFEISFEDDVKAGVSLDRIYNYYAIDSFVAAMNWQQDIYPIFLVVN